MQKVHQRSTLLTCGLAPSLEFQMPLVLPDSKSLLSSPPPSSIGWAMRFVGAKDVPLHRRAPRGHNPEPNSLTQGSYPWARTRASGITQLCSGTCWLQRHSPFQKVAPGLPWTQLWTRPGMTRDFWKRKRGLSMLMGLKIPTGPALASSSKPATGKPS